MKKNDYKKAFKLFIKEIKRTQCSPFLNVNNWALLKDLQNGVQIDYEIKTQADW